MDCSNKIRNVMIYNRRILADYIRQYYPELYLHFSEINDIRQILKIIECDVVDALYNYDIQEHINIIYYIAENEHRHEEWMSKIKLRVL